MTPLITPKIKFDTLQWLCENVPTGEKTQIRLAILAAVVGVPEKHMKSILDNFNEEGLINIKAYNQRETVVFCFLTAKAHSFVNTYLTGEVDPFTTKGQSVINNINNSPGSNLVSQSSGVSITQHNVSDVKQVLERIWEAVSSDQSVEPAKRQEVLDYIKEVEHGVKDGRKPKGAIRSLIEVASNISSIADLALQLGALIPIS